MPRLARLDAPGLLQHVMARGIEGREIFKDDKDRKSFLDRLGLILEETQTQCYAWALLPNHFHLLLRTGPSPLSKVMRRLMTGYAVTFNKRHKRSGHLFQNRYKSVACEEDPYLLELIRYIHLNPIRADLVKDLKQLDRYPWCGHSAILGKRKNPLIPHPPNQCSKLKKPNKLSEREKPLAEKTIEDTLLFFGNDLRETRKRYRHLVKQGVSQGRRPELQGGGLIRSAGGNKLALMGRKKDERERGDERILGSGDFVGQVMEKADELEERRIDKPVIEELLQKVSVNMEIELKELLSSSRKLKVSRARAVLSYLAVRMLSYQGIEISRILNISAAGVSKCVERGRKILDKNKELGYKLIS